MLKPSERYARMTRQEYRAMVKRIETEDPAGKPIPDAEWNAMRRAVKTERKRRAGGARPGAGRKPKAEADKAARVLVSMPRDLLAEIDRAAAEQDLSRAALIAQGMRKLLKL